MNKKIVIIIFLISVSYQEIYSQVWVQKSNPAAGGRKNPIAFSIGNKVYVGSGAGSSSLYNDFWEYSTLTDSWVQKANIPGGGGREAAIGFELGGFGYAGLGWSLNPSSSLKDIYKYNSITNTWTSISNFPGDGGRGSFSTTLNGKAYVGTGGKGSIGGINNEFYEYDPILNSWAQKANFPYPRTGGISFAIGNFIYAGFGHNNVNDFNDLYRYNPLNNTWTAMASFPGVGRLQPVAFNHNGKVIVGSGHRLSGAVLSDYYEYDPASNTWSAACNFLDIPRSNAATCEVGNKGYLFGGRSAFNTYYNELWQLNFDTITIYKDTSICPNSSIFHNVYIPSATYLWNDNSTSASKLITQAGVYFVDITVKNCFYRDSLNVISKPAPQFSLGNDTSICDGDSIFIGTILTNASYQWQDNSTNNSIKVKQGGTYWLEVTKDGCSYRDSINILIKNKPIFSLGSDTSICEGDSILIGALFNNATYQWQDNSTNNFYDVRQGGTYWLEVNKNGCLFRDSINVTYKNKPVFTLGKDTSLCEGDSTILGVLFTNATYQWQDNSTNNFIKVKNGGIYWLEVTENGCSNRDSINIIYYSIPDVNLGNDSVLCEGESIILKGSGALNYLWSTASTDSSITVFNNGTYWLKASNGLCESSDTISVTFNPRPFVELGNDTVLCDLATLNLQSSANYFAYLWQDNSTNNTFTVNQQGKYWLRVTDSNNCNASDTINVKYAKKPTVFLGDDTTICEGDIVKLDVFGEGYNYLWNDGTSKSTFNINKEGIYSVIVSNKCGIAKDSIVIESKNCECNVYIPNAFSPNGDNLNDVFKIVTVCDFSNFELYIFNRKGSQIFESKSLNISWDGNFKGDKVQLGSYPYLIKYTHARDGKKQQVVGTVTVL